jgi:UPF0271 protein
MIAVDLNADLGEGCGHDAELLGLVTSASIACGFHAGDPQTMQATLLAAKAAGVAVGAHPSLADREHFGRREYPISPEDVFALVTYQIGAFAALARAVGLTPRHVKPHGALYNMAARDASLAAAIARAVAMADPALILFAPGNSALVQAATDAKLRVAAEVFADRHYLADGSLVPRGSPDALLHDPDEAAERLLKLLREGTIEAIDGTKIPLRADTVCIHGDAPEAVQFARALRTRLLEVGLALRPCLSLGDDRIF